MLRTPFLPKRPCVSLYLLWDRILIQFRIISELIIFHRHGRRRIGLLYLLFCRDYHNSTKSTLTFKRPGKESGKDPKDQSFDREAHQKKVQEWFLNPTKYARELEAAYPRYPGQCIYHLSKTHLTPACLIKKECERLWQKIILEMINIILPLLLLSNFVI
jgi:hypothetical protein